LICERKNGLHFSNKHALPISGREVDTLLASSDDIRSSFLESISVPIMISCGTKIGDYEPGATMVSLKRVDENAVNETDTRNGKPVSTTPWQISPDGKTLKYSFHDERTGDSFTGTAEKQ
jgi:hypothetical protein